MIDRNAPPGLRLQVFLVIAGFAGAGVVLLWLGLAALLPLIRAISTRAEVVAFSPRNLLPLPLSIAFLALAGLPFLRKSNDKRSRRKGSPAAKRGVDPASVLFAVAVIAAMLSLAILPLSRLVVAAILTDRGYQSCPPPREYDRYAPLRWARPGGRCP